jgi:hypothetical protein
MGQGGLEKKDKRRRVREGGEEMEMVEERRAGGISEDIHEIKDK